MDRIRSNSRGDEKMRLLIASPRDRLAESIKFAEALDTLGVETVCVHDKDYTVVSEFKILKHIPCPRLLRLIKQFKSDFTFTYAPYYTAHMAKLLEQNLLVHLRGDLWTESKWNKSLYRFLPNRMLFEWKTMVMTHGVSKADLILPVSRWLEKQIKHHLPNHPTHVLYRGVDPKEWRPKPNMTLFKLKHPAVVSVFDFEIHPKVVGLLKFMRSIEKMPNVHFYFAGSGPYARLIEQKCLPNVFLLGRLSKSGVQALMASGDIFVHPSGLDALPRSVTEAALMEKPIIASNIGGIPEIVKDKETGYLCDVNNCDEWVERIQFLLNNSDIASRFGRKAREFVAKNFDWQKIAEDFLRRLKKSVD